MESTTNTLKKITAALLSAEIDYAAVRDACSSLFDFFCHLSDFNIDELENQKHVYTSAGLAVSPYAAAFCIMDIQRTRVFLQGIKEAIDKKLNENTGRPVTVFYAGTGPFATLLIPLTTVYAPSQFQIILMDINPISIGSLKKVIEKLGIQPYIIDVVQADALSYIIPDAHQPDILVSETMKPGLQKEPQVSIVANLLPQCSRMPVLIPEKIKIEACLIGNIANDPEAIIPLQTLLELDAPTTLRIKKEIAGMPVISGGIEMHIKKMPANPYKRLALKTTIQVFNKHSIYFNESSLTTRHVLMNMADIRKFPARLLIRYRMENEPGFLVSEL